MEFLIGNLVYGAILGAFCAYRTNQKGRRVH